MQCEMLRLWPLSLRIGAGCFGNTLLDIICVTSLLI
jgi:hypothetical protein